MISKVSTVLSILGGYIVTSIFFFKFPTLLYKKKQIHFVARHISHRGGAGEYYENTMGAFKRVVELGTDMLELDCQRTNDGKIVVAHENNLMRLTGLDKDISSFNYSELPMLKDTIAIDFEPGNYYRHDEPENADRRIPLLEDVFRTFKKLPINIDIKRNDDDLIKEVSRLISYYEREDYCVWGNISDCITKKCFKENPNVSLLFSQKKVILLLIYYYVGVLPFVPLKETHLEICLPSIYERWPEIRKQFPFSKIMLQILDFLLIKNSLFLHLQKRGVQVYLWVLNENDEFERAFKVGATGVMTDYPTRLSEFLKANQQIMKPLYPEFDK